MPAERLRAALSSPGNLPGLVPYVTAGFPTAGSTVPLLLAVQAAGCPAVELGIPFSDPLADGPTIQRAATTALRGGMTMGGALDLVAAARDGGLTIPLAVMTYVNPVFAMGVRRFAAIAASRGVDGVIVPDLPAGEAAELREATAACEVALVPLVAPTTPDERIAMACAGGSGFVYCVSVTGTTGARDTVPGEALDLLGRVRQHTPLPRGLGFGLSRHEHLVQLRGHCEAAVVGSALIEALDAQPDAPEAAASAFLQSMLRG